MKKTSSEQNLVIALFILVLITFSLAQEDTRKMEKGFTTVSSISTSPILVAELRELPPIHIGE
jgi:hypothetical protein